MKNAIFPVQVFLSKVWVWPCKEFEPEESCFDRILFEFPGRNVMVEPIWDTDEILVQDVPEDSIKLNEASEHLKEYFGRTLNQYWTCENAQGYFDLLMLAFDDLQPSLGILSEGSSLKILECERVERTP